jgi:DNA-binding transcriptional LysR family regulator
LKPGKTPLVNAFRLPGLTNPAQVFKNDPLIVRFRVSHDLFADAAAGVSVLSLLSVKSDIADGALKTVRINDLKTIRREFYTALNRRLTLSPVAEAFLDWVFERRAAISDAA